MRKGALVLSRPPWCAHLAAYLMADIATDLLNEHASLAAGLRRSVRVGTVAKILDMSPRQVRKLLKAGEFEGHAVGARGLRIFVDSVVAYQEGKSLAKRQVSAQVRKHAHPSPAALQALARLKALGVFD